MRLPVSLVTCRQAEIWTLSGFSLANVFLIGARTGMNRAAHSILSRPLEARFRSLMS